MPGADKFTCDGCSREMTWKQEYAGRRIKCKHCGQSMVIPSRPNQAEPEQPADDELYALADMVSDAHQAAAALPPTIVEAVVPAALPAAAAAAPKVSKSGIPLAYQRPMTAGEKQRAADAGHVDKNREVFVPLILILVGATLYVGYYAIHYHLGAAGVIGTTIGMAVTTIFETAVLFGFALAIAGPLGVSFGGIGTALLKFAATAAICDGINTWVSALIFGPAFASNGIVGYGAVSFSIALGIYWVCLTYLFAMDPGDSWMVVAIISVMSFILRMVLVLVLLKLLLSFSGVQLPAAAGGASSASSDTIDAVEEAKTQKILHEAKKYAADFGRRAEAGVINDLYTNGAKNVWYETSRDINGKGDAFRIVVELPDDATSRGKCVDAAHKFLNDNNAGYLAADVKDDGGPYMLVPLP